MLRQEGCGCVSMARKDKVERLEGTYLVGAVMLDSPATPEPCLGAKAEASDIDCLLDLGLRTRLALLMNFFKPLGSSFLSPGAPWPEEDIVFGKNSSKVNAYDVAMF